MKNINMTFKVSSQGVLFININKQSFTTSAGRLNKNKRFDMLGQCQSTVIEHFAAAAFNDKYRQHERNISEERYLEIMADIERLQMFCPNISHECYQPNMQLLRAFLRKNK